MDFFNNEQGRNIGQSYNILTPDSNISNATLTAIYNGFLLYLTPLVIDPTYQHDGDIIPGQTQILPTNQ